MLCASGGTAREVWIAIKAKFLINCLAQALQLDPSFRHLVQGDLSVIDYYYRTKARRTPSMTFGEPIVDCTIILTLYMV
jgi:hypothetical protein